MSLFPITFPWMVPIMHIMGLSMQPCNQVSHYRSGIMRMNFYEVLSPLLAWWRHQIETFLRYWPFVRGIHRSPVNSTHKGQWLGALMFSLICARIKGWVNNSEAGGLRRRRGHYDIIVMVSEAITEGRVHPMSYISNILHGYITGTETIICLPQCQRSIPPNMVK